jgi:uncharacterized protein
MNRKKIMSFAIWALIFYIGLLAMLYVQQRTMMYFPDRSRPVIVESVQVAKVTTEDGLQLEGWYIPAKPGMPTFIYFHGNASHYGGRLPKVIDYIGQGYGVLLAGYRGYGGNPGSPGEQGFYKDARAYMKFLQDNNVPLEKTIIYGESIGTGVAVQVATEYKAAALILEAPFSSTVDVAQSIYFFVPVRYLMTDQYRSAEKIKNVQSPILIIHGEQDSTIPIRFGRRLAEAASKPPVFIAVEKAGHNDLYDHGTARHVLDFLKTIGLSLRPDVDQNSHN